jgi:Tfp pilus assembly protein PilF
MRICSLAPLLLRACLWLALGILASPQRGWAEVPDPLDPFNPYFDNPAGPTDDALKSARELVNEASGLFVDERPLDARTKLLKALEKDPGYYQAHMLLAGYYIQHVGHFRLALRYIKQAQALFEKKNGTPPYSSYLAQNEHKQILYLLSQARLNLDDYQGALATLDQFNSHGYFEEWYPGTRAWVLMKLGRLDEAISVARLGVLSGAEGERSLNMLGILLSMKGERQQSLQVFKQAIDYELSLGSQGEPSTPLNNRGEVFKEIFEDDRAETSWQKAINMPSGCQHILSNLNLAILYIDQINYHGAKRSIDAFLTCSAQFPLRNGEEHKALVELARGRIDLHTGHIDQAITHFEAALEQRQWFGKIGTDSNDLQTAAMISLAQALRAKINHMQFYQFTTITERLRWIQTRVEYTMRSWWYLRRARQILATKLKDFEDLEVRHTDSMLEYSTLGEALGGFPESVIAAKLSQQSQDDARQGAVPYYKMYRVEVLLAQGKEEEAFALLEEVASSARPQFDRALALQARTRLLEYLTPTEPDYNNLAEQVFREKRAQLRNYGLRLPVRYISNDPGSAIREQLAKSAFVLASDEQHGYTVRHQSAEGEEILTFESTTDNFGAVKVRGPNLDEVVNRFTDEVFSEDLGKN